MQFSVHSAPYCRHSTGSFEVQKYKKWFQAKAKCKAVSDIALIIPINILPTFK